MTTPTQQHINDRTGRLLVEGIARSKKEFVVELVARGFRFSNADLHGIDLTNANLVGANFSGCDLTDANLRGSNVREALFDESVLGGACLDGVQAMKASFRRISAGPGSGKRPDKDWTRFLGAVLTYADFSGTKLDRVDFTGSSLTGSRFRDARVVRCSFSKTRFGNVDRTGSEFAGNDFRGAVFSADPVYHRIPPEAAPSKSAGGVSVGNTFDKSVDDATVPDLRFDRIFGSVERNAAWMSSTAAVIAATMLVEDTSAAASMQEIAKSVAGTGLAFFGLVVGGGLLVDKTSDKVKTFVSDLALKVQRFVRTSAVSGAAKIRRLSEMAVVVVAGPGADFLETAMRAEPNGLPAGMGFLRRARFSGCTVALARRNTVARCLELAGNGFNRENPAQGDVLVIRGAGGGEDVPTAVKFFSNGSITAFWSREGRVYGVLGFDHMGRTVVQRGSVPRPERPHEIRRKFERTLLDSIDCPSDFRYPPETHQIVSGADGSVVVVRSETSLPDNPNGYVLVRLDGSAYDLEQAKELAAAEEHDEAHVPARRGV